MNGSAVLILCGLLPIVFYSGLAVQSLRDFSRSRLEEICRHRKQEERFSFILRHHEQAMLSWEIVHLTGQLLTILAGLVWMELLPTAQLEWEPATIVRGLFLFALLSFASNVLPWTVARVAGESFLCRTWPVSRVLLSLLKPLLWLTGGLDTVVHRLSGVKEPEHDDGATITEEILTVVDEGQREGVLESEARTMIHRVMELQAADVADIMVPRTDMTCIQVDSSLESARIKLLKAGHSRVPIIGESPDDIIGILYAKDLLNHLNSDEKQTSGLREIVREPFYIPETTGIDTLLQMMKAKRVHLAIVLDEYGGVAGLATMEDILEEIVGEIVDEYDDAKAEQFRSISPGVTEVDARMHVDDVNKRLKLGLPVDRDYDTVGGFTFDVLGRIPTSGESFLWEQSRFTVLEADKRRIVRLRIEANHTLETGTEEPLKQA